ncbi:hypothetical protein ACHAWU_006694 [Discostella pseudostelligera]|uniref:Golgi apparatus membrane protein TVP15 n=1 Tax=Discostella pseudostelligera TaxID=259834 RepID=A0ABD3MX86_9STRA
MDGDEEPSWASSAPAAEAATEAPSSSSSSSAAAAGGLADATTATGSSAKAKASKVTKDNIAGSILGSMNATKKTKEITAAAAAANQAEEPDLTKTILFMRLINMVAAVLLVTVSILQLIGLPAISVWVTAIYASCGGLLVCCLETQLKFIRTIIAMNFGFLFHSIYRFLFYLLLASVSWSYGSVLGKISGGIFGAVGIFNTYILCRYPTYRKMREDIAAEEDNRIRAKINQQVRKQAISNMGWGR